MVLEDALLLLMAAVLSALAVLTSFFIGVEVVAAARDLMGFKARPSRRAPTVRYKRSPGDTEPLPAVPLERRVTPYQDREAVERIIRHLKSKTDEESTPLPRQQTE
jgi:hypothetical protein